MLAQGMRWYVTGPISSGDLFGRGDWLVSVARIESAAARPRGASRRVCGRPLLVVSVAGLALGLLLCRTIGGPSPGPLELPPPGTCAEGHAPCSPVTSGSELTRVPRRLAAGRSRGARDSSLPAVAGRVGLNQTARGDQQLDDTRLLNALRKAVSRHPAGSRVLPPSSQRELLRRLAGSTRQPGLPGNAGQRSDYSARRGQK